jgi:hypothetical protein
MRLLAATALTALALALTVSASGCGQVAGDCSGATPDGAGNCIPDDHGPVAAQQAAFNHYGDQAEQVLCMNHGTFRHHSVEYHGYGCKAIRDGHLQNDEIYCVELRDGVPLSDRQTSALLDLVPLEQQRCS